MMTTDYKITELFCVIDEFCKHFEAENGGKLFWVTIPRSVEDARHPCPIAKL